MQRVEKTGGSNPGEVVDFNGHPLALLNPSGNSWTDLIWAGGSLIAEVPGSQSGSPVYRLLDHEGSLAATGNSAGGILATNLFTPYGQLMNSGAGDAYSWTGLFQDTEYSGDAAWYRNYSTRQARWLTPDPYNGSYDLYDPQSFNRYMYVNGNPLGFTDPSGEADGILNGVGGSPCKAFGGTIPIQPSDGTSNVVFNPCDPVASGIAVGIIALYSEYLAQTTGETFGQAFGSISKGSSADVGAVISAAFTVACSIDYNAAACGPKGWASDVIGGTAGKVVGDSFAVAGATACLMLGPDACIGYAIYTIANDAFAAIWDALGLGTPQFTGSLLPRPTDLGGLGTAPIGIPNQNLNIKSILGQQPRSLVPTPGRILQ